MLATSVYVYKKAILLKHTAIHFVLLKLKKCQLKKIVLNYLYLTIYTCIFRAIYCVLKCGKRSRIQPTPLSIIIAPYEEVLRFQYTHVLSKVGIGFNQGVLNLCCPPKMIYVTSLNVCGLRMKVCCTFEKVTKTIAQFKHVVLL